MLGPPKARGGDDPIAASLEAIAPADHFHRHPERGPGLGPARSGPGPCADRGRPAVDPAAFFNWPLCNSGSIGAVTDPLRRTAPMSPARPTYLGRSRNVRGGV